ncbi:unnamed protein product, partial [Pleuronectes platessa]
MAPNNKHKKRKQAARDLTAEGPNTPRSGKWRRKPHNIREEAALREFGLWCDDDSGVSFVASSWMAVRRQQGPGRRNLACRGTETRVPPRPSPRTSEIEPTTGFRVVVEERVRSGNECRSGRTRLYHDPPAMAKFSCVSARSLEASLLRAREFRSYCRFSRSSSRPECNVNGG